MKKKVIQYNMTFHSEIKKGQYFFLKKFATTIILQISGFFASKVGKI